MSAGLFEIFLVFFRVGLISFGGVFGVLPELERLLVTEHHWITHEQFIQAFVVGQFVPGPNMAMCSLIGYWIRGWPGFLSAFIGIYLAPIVVMGAAYALFTRYRKIEWVHRAEVALRPLVVGLISASAAQIWWNQSVVAGIPAGWTRGAALTLCSGVLIIQARRWLHPLLLILASGCLWWGVESLLR